MKRYSDDQVRKILELRKTERYSYHALGRQTGIPSTTIRNWCAVVDGGNKWDTLIATNERKRQEYRRSETYVINSINLLEKEPLKLLVALLYWCEGSKYPSSTAVTMVNSDPSLIKTFLRLLRAAFELDESKFHVHLQIHTTHDFAKIKRYWSKLLSIPASQFMRPTVTKPNGGKHRNQYFGTCTLKYQDYRILLKLMGIYEAFANKIVQ